MTEKPFIEELNGQRQDKVPFWLMRQAGRYLPEYRELRATAGSFLDLVYNPDFACEVTLQPLRRFGMDAAILFSDILIIPQALGQPLKFVEGEGPRLEPILSASDLKRLDVERIDRTLSPVYETVSNVRAGLKAENFDQTALIGFAGSPWTVACYMVEGKGGTKFENIKRWALHDPDSFTDLINIVSGATLHYLSKQVEAGAEALQLFDSWAGILDEEQFSRWVIGPTKEIVSALKKRHPDIPIIGFPREAGVKSKAYLEQTGVDAIGIDYALPVSWASENLQSLKPVQGNLDPSTLLAGGDVLTRETEKILETLAPGPFVFNLGHGVIKETPVEHVEQLTKIIRDFRR